MATTMPTRSAASAETSARDPEISSFRDIVDALPTMIAQIDVDLRYRFANAAYLEFLRLPATGIAGQRVCDVLGESAYATILPHLEKALSGEPVAFETNVLLRGKAEHYCRVTYVPRRDGGRRIIGLYVLVNDLTELKRNEQRFQRLLESTGAIPWEADAKTWQFTYVGRQATDILGYPIERWYEQDFWPQHIHPDDREWAMRFCETSSQTMTDYDFEYRMRCADGRTVWLHDIVNVEKVDGEPVALRGYMIDVSARKQAEEDLRAAHGELEERVRRATQELANANAELKVEINERKRTEEELRLGSEHYGALLETISHGIEEIDASGTVMLANSAQHRQYEYPEGALVGTSIFDRLAEESELSELREYLQYLVREQPSPTPYFGKRKTRTGKVLDVQVDWGYLRDGEGLVTGFTSIITDITARKQAEAVLRESHDALEARVEQRTKELSAANSTLQIEVSQRKHAEEELNRALAEVSALQRRLEVENRYLNSEVRKQLGDDEIIEQSDAMRGVLAQAAQVASTSSSVLILGETGVGKEVIARWIHDHSPRRERPMVKVNCAALPASLIEAELFGREKGAYTGAISRQIGRFEVADGSTLFLDEIGDLPPEIQTKLLRVLQDGEFERLGSSKTISADVRVIAATNRDLGKAMEEGRFRSDLYYRLNVFPIDVPPLRDRVEDIPALVWTFVKELRETMGKTIERVADKTMTDLRQYAWPGNVRELRNMVERAMIVSDGPTLRIPIPDQSRKLPVAGSSLQVVERDYITQVLTRTQWRVRGNSGAAQLLGLKPTTLEARMKKLGISRPAQG